MKKILYIILIFNFNPINAEEVKCDTALSKLNPKCNFLGKGMEKMKKFSKENRTLDQSYKNIKDKSKTILEKIKK
jgi:hypothetical protein